MVPGPPLVALLSTSTTVVRFHAPAPKRADREAIARAVTHRAFRDDDASSAILKQSCGWVGVHDPLQVELGPADLFFQQYLLVGFRFDRRAVPAKLLFLERRRVEAGRKAERGVDRLGARERREIKDEVEERLMAQALPAPRLFDCAWNLETGRVYFTGKLRAAREAFTDLFRQTFGVGPVPLIPYLAAEHLGLTGRTIELLRAVEPSSLVAPAAPAPTPGVPRLPLEQGVEA